jgi:hypothetical protein
MPANIKKANEMEYEYTTVLRTENPKISSISGLACPSMIAAIGK